MKFGSLLIHNGNDTDESTGALSIPIYQASTYHQKDIEAGQKYNYSRSGNPTREALENTIAILENGARGYAFASGMAAISSALAVFSSGDHVIVCEDVYGGTYRIINTFFKRFNVEFTLVDTTNLNNIKENIKPNTKGLFLETPSNPLLKITDIRNAVKLAKENNLTVLLDNTFMSPYFQKPLDLGVDIVIHSATKFIGGHSDVIAGLIAVKDIELGKKIYTVQNGFGGVLGPQDSWLLLRGLKTLKVRMDYQQNSAQKIAEWLMNHKKVSKIYYPGLPDHPGRDIHYSQATGAGSVLSFTCIDTLTTQKFLKNIKLCAVAVSLGGVETIISYPCKMSHASIPAPEREKQGITDSLVRVSIGLEEPEDLIEDFDQALGR
jgi:cysteine-S-conjugate beta-lyase